MKKHLRRYPAPLPQFVVRVKVPATAANLGAGFDALGLALDYHNELEIAGWGRTLGPELSIQVDGEGNGRLPLNKNNLVYRMMRKVFDRVGKKTETIQIRLVNRVPLAHGMGSSSAAVVGGILAANAAVGFVLTEQEMLKLAVEEEGRPDNVVPAMVGGVCVSVWDGGSVHVVALKDRALYRNIKAVMCVPSFELSTEKARRVLPESVSRADAVFNCARASLFVGALMKKKHELFGVAMEDRLHQPYREKLVPGLKDALRAGRDAGAWGTALSGAGPSVIALSPVSKAAVVGEAMCEAYRENGISALGLALDVSLRGARVTKAVWKK